MKVTGAGGVPATGVTAVAVNITVTETSAFGVIAAGPAGFTAGKTSWTSNLNYGDGQTIANMAIVPVDADGYIDLVNQGPGSASVVLDVNGYYSATAPAAYLPFTPFRVEDTREPTGSKIDAGWITSFGFTADKDGTPDPTTTALVTNTTVANTGAGGFLTVFPDPTPRGGPRGPVTPPNASNLNWGPGQIVPNLVFARPGANGYVSYYNGTPETASNGAIDLIVDVFGVYTTF